ncbi:MAG: hypothetical protein H7138_00295, partial [Myxococcales bacterium]|nr:hypothetical protein [Myxococcales bacterium]
MTVLVLVVAASRVASAQDGSNELPGGATLKFDELQIHEDNSEDLVFPKDPDSLWHYFNLAHCQCGAPGISKKTDYREDKFAYLLTVVNATTVIGEEVTLWAGEDCATNDSPTRAANCTQIGSVASVETINAMMGARPELEVFKLMATTPDGGAGARTVDDCTRTASAASVGTVWSLVNLPGGGALTDYSISETIPIDNGPPIMPTALNARGGESAIQLSWTPPTDTSDSYVYQALCSKASDNTPAITSGRPAPLYDTAASLCEATDAKTEIEMTGVDIAAPQDAPDAGVVTLAGGLKSLDAAFVCGSETNPTATGMRIEGLTNDVAYNVVLLAIDKFGNARGRYFTSTITPIPSIDFWEDLQDRNGGIDGGLCLLAETYGDDSSLTSTLRSFRDTTLRGSAPGRWLANAYYATLGTLGGHVHGSIATRVIAGVVLAPLVAVALLWHWLTLPGLLALVALAWLWRRRSSA